MPTSNELDHEATRKAKDLYVERHKQIKAERKGFLTTLVGLSGGATVLSITLLDKITPHKHYRGFIITAWCFFGVVIVVSILSMLGMIFRSQQFQRELWELHTDQAVDLSGRVSKDVEAGCGSCLLLPETIVGISFLIGILMLTVFAALNLLFG